MTLEEVEQNKPDDLDDADWFHQKYEWLIWVDALADGKRWKWDYFMEMQVSEFLHAVVFHYDRAQFQKEQQKKIDKLRTV